LQDVVKSSLEKEMARFPRTEDTKTDRDFPGSLV
jgi:hypothetical protein